MSAKRTIRGPGIRVELDAAEIIPSDPGAGTPAMVYVGEFSGTFHCALDTGELDAGAHTLTPAHCRWLESKAEAVAEFLAAGTPT